MLGVAQQRDRLRFQHPQAGLRRLLQRHLSGGVRQPRPLPQGWAWEPHCR